MTGRQCLQECGQPGGSWSRGGRWSFCYSCDEFQYKATTSVNIEQNVESFHLVFGIPVSNVSTNLLKQRTPSLQARLFTIFLIFTHKSQIEVPFIYCDRIGDWRDCLPTFWFWPINHTTRSKPFIYCDEIGDIVYPLIYCDQFQYCWNPSQGNRLLIVKKSYITKVNLLYIVTNFNIVEIQVKEISS